MAATFLDEELVRLITAKLVNDNGVAELFKPSGTLATFSKSYRARLSARSHTGLRCSVKWRVREVFRLGHDSLGDNLRMRNVEPVIAALTTAHRAIDIFHQILGGNYRLRNFNDDLNGVAYIGPSFVFQFPNSGRKTITVEVAGRL